MTVNDGSAHAPVGSPQYASLLDKYGTNGSPWNVAGVDYRVGVPEGLTLKNPATISIAGVSVNTGSRSITITGSNVTLDGYDFSGWSVVTTAANTRLINSKFDGANTGGTQSSVISGTSTSSNLYVGYSTIDGMSGAGGRAEFLVEMQGPGLTIEFSWLKSSNSDLIGRHGRSGGDIVIQNNLLEQAGMVSGAHGDYLQVYGPTIDSTVILFNTAIQNGGSTQGFIADNTRQGEFGNNVMIGSVTYWMSASGPNTDAANMTGPFTVHDNYFDISKAYGFNYPSAGPNDSYAMTSFTHNVNMVTGQLVQDWNAPVELRGGAGNDTLLGGAGDDRLHGEGGADIMTGGAGNDRLNGGTRQDVMKGGLGDDTYIVDNAGDVVTELADEGTDTARSSTGYTLPANVENLTLTGSANINGTGNNLANLLVGNIGNNVLDGKARADTLWGGNGQDRLGGDAGDDVLIGGSNADFLVGGAGRDTFGYLNALESTSDRYDTIVGFDTADDLFDLPVSVSGIDPAIASGHLSASKLNADLAAAANGATLLAHHAAIFTPDRGAHAGETFLIVDANGVAGYQAREDFVFRLANPAAIGALSTNRFV